MTARLWAALGIVYVVWGSTYLAIMVGIRTLPPLSMASARFLVAGAMLVAWAWARGARPRRADWLPALVTGAAMLAVGNGGVTWAEQHVDSGVAALLIASIPLWLALLDRAVLGRRLPRSVVLGLAIGFGGVALLVGPAGGGSIDRLGALVLLVSAVAWAAGSLYTSRVPQAEHPLLGAGLQMLAGGAVLAVAGLAGGEAGRFEASAVSAESLLALAYLVVFGSLLAFSAYVWLLKTAPTALVSTYAYVNPVVAVLLGAAFLGEAVTLRMLVAGLAIVVAVALIVRAQAAPARERARREAAAEPAEEAATLAA